LSIVKSAYRAIPIWISRALWVMTGPTRKLAEYAATLSYDDLPPQVVRRAKTAIMDSLACTLGGSGTDIGVKILSLVKSLGGSPESTVIGGRYKASSPLAAFANAHLANALDFDDFIAGNGHAGTTIIPAAIPVAEALGESGKKLLSAVVAGYEVSVRIGKAIDPSPARRKEIFGQSHYQIFGAVSAAGNLLGLDGNQMAKAFGIAGSTGPVPAILKVIGPRGANMIKNAYGHAVMDGIIAAMLAKDGFTGPDDILDGPDGLWKICGSDRCDFELMTHDLGKDFETYNLGFKPYSCCRWIHPTLDAALEIVRQHKVEPAEIDEITVRSVTRLTVWRPYEVHPPETMVEAQFCAPYALAVAILGFQPGPDWYTKDRLTDPNAMRLARKVKLIPDLEADSSYPPKIISKVEVRTRKGTYTHRVDFPKGDPNNPMTDQEIQTKFNRLAAKSIEMDRIKDIVDKVHALERSPDVRELAENFS